MRKTLLLKILVISFASFNFSGCGSDGPLVTTCISSPKERLFRCHDYKKNKDFTQAPEKIAYKDRPSFGWPGDRKQWTENWICMDPFDSKATLDACKQKQDGPLVNACIVGDAKELFLFHCYDEPTKLLNRIPFDQTENYVCLSPFDQKAVLDYCKRKKNE